MRLNMRRKPPVRLDRTHTSHRQVRSTPHTCANNIQIRRSVPRCSSLSTSPLSLDVVRIPGSRVSSLSLARRARRRSACLSHASRFASAAQASRCRESPRRLRRPPPPSPSPSALTDAHAPLPLQQSPTTCLLVLAGAAAGRITMQSSREARRASSYPRCDS